MFSTESTLTFPPAVHEDSIFSTFSSTLVTVCFLGSNPLNGCRVASPCGFCPAFKALSNQALLSNPTLIHSYLPKPSTTTRPSSQGPLYRLHVSFTALFPALLQSKMLPSFPLTYLRPTISLI